MPEYPRGFGHDAHSIYFNLLGEHGWVGLGFSWLLVTLTMFRLYGIRRLARARPEIAWAANYAHMIQASLATYLMTGAFLSAAYFDLAYQLIVLVPLIHALAVRELAAADAPPVPAPAPAPRAQDGLIMCGIVGVLHQDRAAGGCGLAEADDGHDRPPRTRRRRVPRGWAGRPRAPAALHHRPRRRRPADGLRGRLGVDHLQRRDLQLPGAPPGARGARGAVPHLVRHRGDRGRVPGLGAGVPLAPARHVRLRDLGRGAGGGCSWRATAPGIKPLVYAWDGRRLRFASELKALLQDPAVPRELDWDALQRLLDLPVHPRPPDDLPGDPQAAAGLVPGLLARTAASPRSARTGICAWTPRPAATRGGLGRGAGPPAPRGGAHAHGERRAGRRLPERRARLEHGGGLHGPERDRAREDLLDRLRRAGLRRAARTRGWWRPATGPSTSRWS